jgi:anti-sigma regulatory factor (Ser/Thr protein kinase)
MADQLTVPGALRDLEQIGTWVDDFAQRLSLPASTAFAIQLCCEEVFSNIVRHGLKGSALGEIGEEGEKDENGIKLCLDHVHRSVILRIDDQAEAFDPLAIDSPLHPQSVAEASVGGLGIHLVRKFAQDVRYERRGQTNSLTMRFDLPQASASGSGSLASHQHAKAPASG